MRRLHVVGAGVAGLSAALAGLRAGFAVTLHEAAPQAGGRCRTLRHDGHLHDNGTHVLLGANRRALAFLEAVGARADWVEPEPEGLPVYDASNGRLARVGLSPWSWIRPDRRPEGLNLLSLARLIGLTLPLPDRPVAAAMGAGPLFESLVEPLTVAVLNTPAETASSRRLGRALRRLGAPGAARLLVARRGLGPDLVEPALARLGTEGAAVRFGARLREVERDGGRVAGLIFATGRVPVAENDRVVLALPPGETGRLIPGLAVPEAYEPILNVHYRVRVTDRPRFVGLRGALSQWVLARPDGVSVTVSAAGGSVGEDAERLAGAVWCEIAPALAAAGLSVAADGPTPPARVVKEKRATIRQAVGHLPPPPVRPLANLALAGDWVSPLPATIEGAVATGEAAVAALSGPFRRGPRRTTDAAPAAASEPAR